VQKRRIYDITNVLEGIGLIEKKGKNNIQWRWASSARNSYRASAHTGACSDINRSVGLFPG